MLDLKLLGEINCIISEIEAELNQLNVNNRKHLANTVYILGNDYLKANAKWAENNKAKKEALKELKESYINRLTEALPKIDPVLIQKGIDGDLQAIKEINDRVLGKPKQQMELSGDKDNPIIVKKIEYAGNNNPTSLQAEGLPIVTSPGDTKSKV